MAVEASVGEDEVLYDRHAVHAILVEDFSGLWTSFCAAAAAAGRLRILRVGLSFSCTAVVVHGLVQLRSLQKLDLRLACLHHADVGELAHLSSLSALTGLWLRVGVRASSQPLRLPPQLAALSRLEHLMGAAGRCSRLACPAQRACRRPGLLPISGPCPLAPRRAAPASPPPTPPTASRPPLRPQSTQ